MRWVVWVVLASACGQTAEPKPRAAAATSSAVPVPVVVPILIPVPVASLVPSTSAKAPSPEAIAEAPRTAAQAASPSSRLCEVVIEGLTILRPCTGAPGEKPSTPGVRSKRPNCLVSIDGLEIIRPCEGKPNERPAPASKPAAASVKMCEVVEGNLVRLAPCPKQ